ncbi:MAG: TIGR03619 family F420-dependent LLM class oxidoreductase [Pseudomonadales bacterium]|nr:TIGR03619 family F420-dependent LLM class oxidoreductase [Pseudomonadales bacterium]
MTIGIGLGLSRFPFAEVSEFWRWVQLCDEAGVNSLWQTDRLVTREPMLESLATMAALAGATRRIRFGMNVASIALRDPLLLARQCATIDMLSEGRLLPAFGIGSALSDDYRATGTPTRRRGKKADEALQLVRQLWQQESVDFDGEFFHYQRASIAPKPANPSIPLWIGGSSEAAMQRVARYGTGWLGGLDTPAQAAVMVRGIREALKVTGRKIDDDHYGATFSFRFGDPEEPVAKAAIEGLRQRLNQDPADYLAIGDGELIRSRVLEFVRAGCQKFVLLPISTGDKDMFIQTQKLIDEVITPLDNQSPETLLS